MTSESARKLVLVSMLLLAAISYYRVRQGDQGALYKRLWGVGVIGLVLSVAADFVPGLAGPFSLLVLLGSLTNGGDQAIQGALSGVANRVPTAPAATGSAPRPSVPAPSVPVGGTR